MKVYFINPKFPLSFWDFSFCRDLDGSKYPHYPLSLPTLAALTPEPWQVELCDENVSAINFASDAEVIALTAYHIQKDRLFEIADTFKRQGKTVVIGGPIIEAGTIDECLQHVDVIFQGEAEYTWPQFLSDFEHRAIKSQYRQETFIDMADSPVPRFDLLPISDYSTATIETSRGCPYDCEFCEIPSRLGKKARTKSTAQVLTEVQRLYALGVDSIFFIDDHFIGHRKRTIELLRALEEFVRSINYRVYFTCQISINYSKDHEILELLNRANFKRVFVGIETPRSNVVGISKKTRNLQQPLVDAIKTIQSYGLTIWAGLIVGFDTDDRQIFADQLELLERSGIPVAMIGVLQAIPGTPLYARMQQAGRIKNHEIGGIRGGYQGQLYTNIVSRFDDQMSEQELLQGYQSLVKRAYSYFSLWKRMRVMLQQSRAKVYQSDRKLSRKEKIILRNTLKYYLATFDLKRPLFFFAMILAGLLTNYRRLDQVFLHLVVFKHLREYYLRVAAQPL